MVTAVIFDLYGVLAINGWQAFKAKHFADREAIWDQVFQLGRKVDAGQAEYSELIRFTAEQSGESEATVRYQLEHTLANEQLLDFIAGLKPRYKIGILTNASDPEVVYRIFTEQQRGLFDAMTFSHEIGRTKPDPEIYAIAAARLGVPLGTCVFVDDQERHAAGAREVGMQAVVYHDVPHLKQELGGLL